MKPGDDCPQQGCKGHIVVRQSQRRKRAASVVRYLKCWKCGHDCGKTLVPRSEVQRRRKRQS